MASIDNEPNAQTINVMADVLEDYATKILTKAVDMPEADARITASNLVFGNLRGVDTHGIARLGVYLAHLEKGKAVAKPNLSIIKDNGASVLADADHALGQVAANYGMKIAIERAKKYGLSWVGVRNGGHIGALAYWSMMALEHNMIGICTTSTTPVMAAWGSKETTAGNTPISIAAPSGSNMPLVLDMALSVAARGNLFIASRQKTKVPDGWAIDKDGVPTNDPDAALLGSVLPIGTYKGSGLAMMIEVLTGVLMGSNFGTDKGQLVPPNLEKPLGLTHLFIALPIENFIPIDMFKTRMDELIRQVKESALSKDIEEVLVPNDKEYRNEQTRRVKGIPLNQVTADELRSFSGKYNIPCPF